MAMPLACRTWFASGSKSLTGVKTPYSGGNSSFNPIDVAALRRPGAEIKDALLPVEAIYGSLAITEDITLEAYYGGWDEYSWMQVARFRT